MKNPLALLATLLVLLLSNSWGFLMAQEGAHSLPGRVLSVAEGAVEIDLGLEDGLEPGDWVTFSPLGAPDVTGSILRVEGQVAWVNLKTLSGIEPGVACQVSVPSGRIGKTKSSLSGRTDLPSAPPVWSRKTDSWNTGRPLLAEEPLQPEERTAIWSGRFYTSFQGSKENDELDSSSYFARTGLDLRGENPFGNGGRFQLGLDFDYRSYSATGESTSSESAARIERFSYAHGGDRFHPLRWEVGRFLPSLFPEFGVLDGAEVQYRLPAGSQFGASFGYMPEPGADYSTGKDLQAAAFYRQTHGEDQTLRWGGGLQKTWHEGEADRDLMLLKLDYIPSRSFRFYSSAWVDFYRAEDVGKPDGAELTTLQTRASWRDEEVGGSFGFRQWRYPQLLRYQAGSFTNFELLNESTSRADLRLWRRWDRGERLSGRVDSWQSDDASGGSVEVRLDWPDLLWADVDSSISLYSRQGSYTDSNGLRFDQFLGLDSGTLRMTWETASYQPTSGSDGDSDLLQHDLRLSWSHWSREGWSLSLDAGYRFGDQQNSPSLGFYLQRSF